MKVFFQKDRSRKSQAPKNWCSHFRPRIAGEKNTGVVRVWLCGFSVLFARLSSGQYAKLQCSTCFFENQKFVFKVWALVRLFFCFLAPGPGQNRKMRTLKSKQTRMSADKQAKMRHNERCAVLPSRGPGTEPCRASSPKWGRKWPKNRFWWPHPENGGKTAEERTQNGSNMGFGPFSPFCGCFSHMSRGRQPKSIFQPKIFTISGLRPKMDLLYQVHGIASVGSPWFGSVAG